MFDWKNFIQQHRWLVYGGFSLLLFIYAFTTHIIPLAQQLMQISTTIAHNEEQVANVHNWRSSINQVSKRNSELRAQVKALVLSQSHETQLSKILIYINHSADKLSLRILILEPQPIKRFERHIELPIQIRLSTTYHNLGTFINRLETGSILAKVSLLKIDSEKMTSNTLIVQLTLDVLYLKQTS